MTRLLSPDQKPEDEVDATLRPQRLEDFVGQAQARSNLRVFIEAARSRGTITASGITPGGHGMSILVVGTTGALKLDNQDQLWCKQGANYPATDWEPVRLRQSGPPLNPWAST